LILVSGGRLGQSERVGREAERAAGGAAQGAALQTMLPAGETVLRKVPETRRQLLRRRTGARCVC
jgi:hypothetical protein